jgi:hypothetical protein
MVTSDLEQILKELPEIEAEKDVWQNKFHEFDVYDHTMSYVNYLKEMTSDFEMIVAGYLHDIGKPVVKKPRAKGGTAEEKEPGKPYHKFDDHENVGERMVRDMGPQLFNQYGLNQNRIAKLVGAHFVPMKGIKEMRKTSNYEDFVSAYHKLEETLDKTDLPREDVMTMFLADCLSKGKGCTDIEELKLVREVILINGQNLEKVYVMQKEMYNDKE